MVRISELPELAVVAQDDVLVVNDASDGQQTKQVTVAALRRNRTVANTAALSTITNPQPGEIVTVADTGDNYQWNATDGAWRRIVQSSRVYPFLRTTTGAINSAILADITAGRLAVGDAIETASYWTGRGWGGASYRLAASGTPDGGSVVAAGTLMLVAVFGPRIDAAQFGAFGDGVARPASSMFGSLAAAQAVWPVITALTDELDWAALQTAANVARTENRTLACSAPSLRINRTVQARFVRTVEMPATTVTCWQTDEPGIVVGWMSGQRVSLSVDLGQWVHSTGAGTPDPEIRRANINNPTVRAVGMKNGTVKCSFADYFQVYADGATVSGSGVDQNRIDSFAYTHFEIGFTRKLEIRGVGDGWINENTFDIGDAKRLEIIGDQYSHNHNHIQTPVLETGSIVRFENVHNNLLNGVRFEGVVSIEFDALCHGNVIERTWDASSHQMDSVPTHHDLADVAPGTPTALIVKDPSGRNSVRHARNADGIETTLVRLDRTTLTTGDSSEAHSLAPSGTAATVFPFTGTGHVRPGFTSVQIPVEWRTLAFTDMIRVRASSAIVNGSIINSRYGRMTKLWFNSDRALWRPMVFVYDANGLPLDGASQDYMAETGGWVWVAPTASVPGHYGWNVNVGFARMSFERDVHFVRVAIRAGGGTTNEWFNYAELCGYSEPPASPGLHFEGERAARPVPLAQVGAVQRSLLPLGAEIRVGATLMRVAFRRDMTVASAALAAATTIDVSSATGVAAGDLVAVHLANGQTHHTTVTGVAGSVLTLAAALPADVSLSARVVASRLAPSTTAAASGTVRPTLTAADVGFQFFDAALTPPRMIVWNGSDWVNVDGTSL